MSRVPQDDTGYWNHNLFYGGDADVDGEELYFSTSVDGVLDDPAHYKALYEKVYAVRSAEVHYLLKRMPPAAAALGVVLMGTSEGAMTVHRFDDQRYAPIIVGRIVNAFSCEHCYFTPTPDAALLGGAASVPTLNLIGTCDEYFGPPPDPNVSYRTGCKQDAASGLYGTQTSGWRGSIAYDIARDTVSGYGDPHATGNAFAAFVRQRLRRALVCTIVGAQHDATLNADNQVRDVVLAFLTNPESCTRVHERWVATSAGYAASTRLVARHEDELSEVVHIELGQPATWRPAGCLDPATPYATYLREAERWARKAGHRRS